MESIDTESVGIIILAAGGSRRFGKDKRCAVLTDGTTLLAATLANVPDCLSHRILVLKKEDRALASRFASHWEICIADRPESGMANSLACGIEMAAHWPGALIGLGDMPFISPATYAAIQQALGEHEVVIPCVGSSRGNPVAFRQRFFKEIGQLDGDQGAKSLLEKYRSEGYELETGDEGILRDVDTPEMLT